MTIEERRMTDKKYRRMSRCAKFIRRNVNKKLGAKLLGMVYESWDRTFD